MLRLVPFLCLFALVQTTTAHAAARDPVWSRGGMVASSVGPSVPIGRDVLARGGNAIDAAVATSFAVGCAHHFSSGIGGGGFIVYRLAETGEAFAVDAREVGPAAAHAGMYLREDGSVDPQLSRVGGLAVAVPGLVQGLHEVHARHGRLPWKELVQPAVELCRAGVPVSVYHRRILGFAKDRLAAFPETAAIQLQDGNVPELGWKLVQSDLARSYERIAALGPRAMTEGPIADAIVASVKAHGGILTHEDLRSYRTVWREPVRGTYRAHEVISMPPPSSGGAHLIQMLNTLEPFDLYSLGPNSSEAIHLIAEAMKLAFADRAVFMGDPDFHPVPTERLISKAYGLELARRVEGAPFWQRPPWTWGRPRPLEVDAPVPAPRDDEGTTHISVVDRDGNAVALTQTVNTLFGSLITAPGTGIVLNNEMDDFAAAPATPNAFDLIGFEANAVAAGKRPLSSMTPTIVLRDARVRLVAGSPMGPLIITTVLQTLLNVIDFEMDVQAAVSAPRFHHQWRPDLLSLEADHPRDVVEALEARGHPIRVGDFGFGASAAILYDPSRELFFGAEDPRRDAGAAGPSD